MARCCSSRAPLAPCPPLSPAQRSAYADARLPESPVRASVIPRCLARPEHGPLCSPFLLAPSFDLLAPALAHSTMSSWTAYSRQPGAAGEPPLLAPRASANADVPSPLPAAPRHDDHLARPTLAALPASRAPPALAPICRGYGDEWAADSNDRLTSRYLDLGALSFGVFAIRDRFSGYIVALECVPDMCDGDYLAHVFLDAVEEEQGASSSSRSRFLFLPDLRANAVSPSLCRRPSETGRRQWRRERQARAGPGHAAVRRLLLARARSIPSPALLSRVDHR